MGTVWAVLRSSDMTGAGLEKRPERSERCATAWAEEAVVSDVDEPLWQPMLEEAVDKRSSGQRPALPPRTVALLEAEGDVPVFERFNPVVGDGNPGDGGGEGGEELGAGARRFAVGHPGLVPDLGRPMREQASGCQGLLARAPEDPGARSDRHQPVRMARGEPW